MTLNMSIVNSFVRSLFLSFGKRTSNNVSKLIYVIKDATRNTVCIFNFSIDDISFANWVFFWAKCCRSSVPFIGCFCWSFYSFTLPVSNERFFPSMSICLHTSPPPSQEFIFIGI